MSQETFEIVKTLDLRNIETQLVLQCAPLIARLKISNLLNIRRADLHKVRCILRGTEISFYILLSSKEKVTLLLYRKRDMERYLAQPEIQNILQNMGYACDSLLMILLQFRQRYEAHMQYRLGFPHEMGILLGYPLEDVRGFIENQGQNALLVGYWKVYSDLTEKQRLFNQFEQAKELLVQQISNGVSIVDIIHRMSA